MFTPQQSHNNWAISWHSIHFICYHHNWLSKASNEMILFSKNYQIHCPFLSTIQYNTIVHVFTHLLVVLNYRRNLWTTQTLSMENLLFLIKNDVNDSIVQLLPDCGGGHTSAVWQQLDNVVINIFIYSISNRNLLITQTFIKLTIFHVFTYLFS